jgi:putative ABC transport system permease protein
MGIILKFVLRNIKENKFRTFLIIFSITLSAALFFSAMAISDTVAEMYLQRAKSQFGSAEIMITPNKDSPSSLFRAYKANEFNQQLEYVVGAVNKGGRYSYQPGQTIPVTIRGYEYSQLQKMNPIRIQEQYNLDPFQEKKVIISREAANKYDLSLGSSLNLQIKGYKHNFIVSGIANSRGLFRPQEGRITVVVPREKLASLYGARGRVSTIYIKTKPEVSVQQMIKQLNTEYDRYEVRKTLTRQEMKEYTSMITTPIKLMLPLVVLISVFIIYTSFKVITMERLPVVGTFRSIGATRRMTDFILLGESMTYGIIGGLLGCGLGLGILYIMKQVMASTAYMEVKTGVEMVYSMWQLVTAFVGAVGLAIVSSLLPIIKVSKISVKDIVLNNIEDRVKNKQWKMIVGIILLVAGIVTPFLVAGQSWALIADASCMLVIGVGIVLLIPQLTNLCIYILEKIYPYILGNEGLLAVKNLRNNKSVMNNIALLTIGIASLLMINTTSYSTSLELVNVYSDAQFQIWGGHPQADRRIIGRLKAIKGVKDVYGLYRSRGVKVTSHNQNIGNLYGVDGNQFFNYWDFNLVGDKEELLAKFSKGRKIILTSTLQEKLKVDLDDVITLQTARGKKPYQVAGFVNTIFNGGNAAFASAKYFKRDMKMRYKDDIYIKTYQSPDKVVKRIKEKFNRENIHVETIARMQEQEMKMWTGLLTLLKGFSVITMIIGIFGVFNNFMVEFISRKRTLAIFRSVGMSKFQTVKMILIEAVTGGLIGGIVGCFGGGLFIKMMELVLQALNLAMPMHYSLQMFVIAIISGIIVSVLSAIIPTLKSTKLNIVEAIKYE